MSASFEQPDFKPTGLSASADLSAKQYRFVKVSGALTVTACAATTDRMIGVLQNAPLSGESAEVMNSGVSFVKAGGAIAAGAVVSTDANGDAVSITVGTDTTRYIAGTALDAADSGDILPVLLNPNPGRAS